MVTGSKEESVECGVGLGMSVVKESRALEISIQIESILFF